jgi:transposase
MHAVWIALTRLRWDPRTKAYVQKRIEEGKTKREILCCLKRFIAREVFRKLVSKSKKAQPAGALTTA